MIKNESIKVTDKCQICSKNAVGYHYGAYVCEACKKFFVRHSSGICRLYGSCQENGQCDLAISGRGKCQHCRFKKCTDIGMSILYKSSDYNLTIIPCQVCGAKSSGLHFGCITCEGCKGFFRRMVKFDGLLICFNNNKCQLNSNTRSACKSCRLERCIHIGMSRKGIRIGRHPNSLKYNCITLMKSEKAALELKESIFLDSTENTKSEVSSDENYKPPLSDTENASEDNSKKKVNDDLAVKSFKEEHTKESIVELEEEVSSKEGFVNILDSEVNNNRPSSIINVDRVLFSELEEHITQIINNISPSSVFLTQKESKVSQYNKGVIQCPYSAQNVWSVMMDHFVSHSQFIVKFAKLIPGFSKLSLLDKKTVIKYSMYPMILLELSQEYFERNGEILYNYFDFSSSDRTIILTLFPEFIEFSNHLKRCGSIKAFLRLDGVELTLLCGIIMFYNHNDFSDSVFGQSMLMLYQDFLMIYFESKLRLSLNEANKRRSMCLQFIVMLNEMNESHHKIITDFCISHLELQYPDLYIEIFNN